MAKNIRASEILAGKTLMNRQFEDVALSSNGTKELSINDYFERFAWDADKKRYINMVTQGMWIGFCLGVRVERENVVNGTHFVIAHANEQNRPTFSVTPHYHKTFELGHAELKRLSEKVPGRKFILYKSVTAIRKPIDVSPEWQEILSDIAVTIKPEIEDGSC